MISTENYHQVISINRFVYRLIKDGVENKVAREKYQQVRQSKIDSFCPPGTRKLSDNEYLNFVEDMEELLVQVIKGERVDT